MFQKSSLLLIISLSFSLHAHSKFRDRFWVGLQGSYELQLVAPEVISSQNMQAPLSLTAPFVGSVAATLPFEVQTIKSNDFLENPITGELRFFWQFHKRFALGLGGGYGFAKGKSFQAVEFGGQVPISVFGTTFNVPIQSESLNIQVSDVEAYHLLVLGEYYAYIKKGLRMGIYGGLGARYLTEEVTAQAQDIQVTSGTTPISTPLGPVSLPPQSINFTGLPETVVYEKGILMMGDLGLKLDFKFRGVPLLISGSFGARIFGEVKARPITIPGLVSTPQKLFDDLYLLTFPVSLTLSYIL